MMKVLPPDEAKKRARENLAEWKRHKAEAAIREKRELTSRILWTIDGGTDGYAESRLSDMRERDPDWHKGGFDMDSFMMGIRGPMLRSSRELLEKGADANHRGKHGTLLMMAAENGDAELVELLIKHGADVDAREPGGSSALMIAAFYASERVVRLLVENGAALDAVDESGWTALMHAAAQYHPTCYNLWQQISARDRPGTVGYLIGRGADASKRNDEGKTALQLAREIHEDPEIMDIFAKHGIKG